MSSVVFSKGSHPPRVIIEWPTGFDTDKIQTYYAAGYIEGYSGNSVYIIMPIGVHQFSRSDGKWLSGDCLNYKDARIMEFDRVEASIQNGQGGDVEAYEKSLPMCVNAAE